MPEQCSLLTQLKGYEGLTNNRHDSVCIVNEDKIIVFANRVFQRIHRISYSAGSELPIDTAWDPRLVTSIKRDLDIAFTGRMTTASRTIQDGVCSPAEFHLTFLPLFDNNNCVQFVALLGIDVTHRSLKKMCEVKNGEPVNTLAQKWDWEMDENLRFTYVSPHISLTTPNSVSWFIGKTRDEIFASYHNLDSIDDLEDKHVEKQLYLDHLKLIAEHKPFDNFIYSCPKNNQIRWMSISGVPIYSQDSDHRFLGYRGIGHDVTELHLSLKKQLDISRAVETLSSGFAIFDRNDNLSQYNRAFLNLLDIDRSFITENFSMTEFLYALATSETIGKILVPLDKWVNNVQSLLSKPKSAGEWQKSDGSWLAYDSEITHDGLTIIQIYDNDQQKKIEQRLADESNMLKALLSHSPDCIYILDNESRYLCANAATAKLHGRSDPKELIGKTLVEDIHTRDAETILAEERQIIEKGNSVLNKEVSFLDPLTQKTITHSVSKIPFRNNKNEVIGIVGHAKDITYLHSLTEKLAIQAEYDDLTGLVNRRGFTKHLQSAIDSVRTSKIQSVLCFVDLDQFKIVNDTVGHMAGDELLKNITSIVKQNIRKSDTFARLGGDEFGLIFSDCTIDVARKRVSDFIEIIGNFRFQFDGKLFKIGASVGMVELVSPDQTVKTALSQADVACYTAKELGRGRYHVFNVSDRKTSERQDQLNQASDIRSALDENRFSLYLQPISSYKNGSLLTHHHEVLVRMISRNGEIIPPNAFIPAAERYELMYHVDCWVIDNALKSFNKLCGSDNNSKIAINLSGVSLNQPALVDFVKNQLNLHQFDPTRICFEITETAFVSNLEVAQSFVREIREIGCSFALDDFGSGLSSFAYLKHFNVDYLKIDGSFVKNMITDPSDRAMVSAINDVGHALGIQTIAEFVETDEHILELSSLGVDYLQGYGIGRPIAIESIAEFKEGEAPKSEQLVAA
ncbi:MAG: EAL domain-containing protein [Acidiferrobacterales bacterium]|nr:EAL domain-containing protein [Acidiferrobacterales bacterium]